MPDTPCPSGPSLPPTHELFRQGTRRRMMEHSAGEADKIGTLRAGNTGIFIDDGTVAGHCHRKAVLRFLGIEAPKTAEEEEGWERRQLMFEAGHANEDAWDAVLRAAIRAAPSVAPRPNGPAAGGPPQLSVVAHADPGRDVDDRGATGGLRILREEEYPTSWVLRHGGREIRVTGRPDLVVGYDGPDGVFVPLRGYELKLASSVYTWLGAMFEGEPKLEHLCQAGHYLMAMEDAVRDQGDGTSPRRDGGRPCEYELWYTNRTDLHAKDFFKKSPAGKWEVAQDEAWPKHSSDPYAKYVEFAPPQKGRPGRRVKKAGPGISGYSLRFDTDGTLLYKHLTAEDAGKDAPWKRSAVSKDRIVDYYRYVTDTARMKDLGPRVSTLRADGTRHRFSICDYCELKPICVKHEAHGFAVWVDAVQKRHLEK